MLNFKEFLSEEEEIKLPYAPDVHVLENNLDQINALLDKVTDTIFVNSAVFFNTVRSSLENFSIIIPRGYEVPMMSMEAETSYALADTGYYLYVVHDMNDDGWIEGYAQVVDEDELTDLLNMDSEELTAKDEEQRDAANNSGTSEYLLRVRRSDD